MDDEAAESAAVDGVSGSLLEVSVIDVLRRGKDVRYLSVHSLNMKRDVHGNHHDHTPLN